MKKTKYVVFGFASYFDDDVKIKCEICSKIGYCRPETVKQKGTKICVKCFKEKENIDLQSSISDGVAG